MRALVRFAGALAFLLSALVAHAATPGQRMLLLSGCPAQVQVGGICPSAGLNFQTGTYYAQGVGSVPLTSLVTTTRASAHMCQYANGTWISVGNNVACVTDQGFLIEEARTNDALWSRDLTQASWVKVGMGTALNAVGIDGTANSATTLTATGTASSCTASCTALQSITLGSTADTYSVWLKRVSGTGVVNITINNLVGTTACTLVTGSFTRCTVTDTLANPTIGIQMAGLNDVIVADFNQMEPGGFVTSPILTTTVVATRAADVPQLIGPALTAALKAKSAFFQTTGGEGISTAAGHILFSTNARMQFISTTSIQIINSSNQVTAATIGNSGIYANTVKVATGMDATSTTIIANGGTKTTQAFVFDNAGSTSATLGNGTGGGIRALNGYMQRFALSPVKGVFDGQTAP